MKTHPRRQSLPVLLLISLLVHLQCIKRDNPWDPYNGCHPTLELPKIEEKYQILINSLQIRVTDSLPEEVDTLRKDFHKVFDNNIELIAINDANIDSAEHILAANTLIDEQNRTSGDCKSAQQLRLPGNFKPVRLNLRPGIVNQLKMHLDTLTAARTSTDSLFLEANTLCNKQVVIKKSYIDSIFFVYDSTFSVLLSLNDSIKTFNQLWIEANRVIDSIATYDSTLDIQLNRYNDSIAFCQHHPITDSALVEQALTDPQPGDTIAIDVANLPLSQLNLTNKGSETGPYIVIMGNPTTLTNISGAEQVLISGSKRIIIMNFNFTDMKNGLGAKVTDHSDSIQFINCRFVDNRKYGFNAENSSGIRLQNCLILHNGYPTPTQTDSVQGSGGVRLEAVGLFGINLLIAKNSGNGIEINNSELDLYWCTISDSRLNGIQYSGQNLNGTVRIYNSLICYNEEYGIWRSNEKTTSDIFVHDYDGNRFWMNTLGSLEGPSQLFIENTTGGSQIVMGNPDFIDRANDDYRFGPNGTLKDRNIGFQYKP